ncbi:hypothetical protein BJV74DRAFT_108854 [Russula compacta]|nr:hypothetical protein BJV74DRAFT_108854 [Russula compacta]
MEARAGNNYIARDRNDHVTLPLSARACANLSLSRPSSYLYPIHNSGCPRPRMRRLWQREAGHLGRASVSPSRHAGIPHGSVPPSRCWFPRRGDERTFACATATARATRRSPDQTVRIHFLILFSLSRLRRYRLSPELEWGTGRRSGGDKSMDTSQLWLPVSQTLPTSGNSLQLQGT